MTRRPLAFLCVLCIVIFAVLTYFGLPPERGQAEKGAVYKLLEVPRDVTVTGEVLRSEEQEDYSYLFLKQAVLSVHSQTYNISNVRITLKVPVHYAVGIQVSAFGMLKPIEEPANPGQFDRAFYYRLRGIGYTMSDPQIQVLSSHIHPASEGLAIVREALRERIRDAFPKETAGIISAMILGDKSLLTEDVRTGFSMGGVSHMLAISGLHISLFGEGLYRLLLLIPFFGRGRKKGAGALAIVILISYAVLTGLSVATIRAVIMFAVMRGADFAGRTYDPPTAIAFAALLIVIEQPLYVFYSGFILSFLAVTVFTVFYDRSGIVTGLILFLVTLPVILWSFYEFSSYTILINFIVVPLVPFVLLFGLFGTIFGGICSGLFSLPAVLLLKAIMAILAFFRRLPYANFILGRPEVWQIILYYLLLVGFLYFLDKWRARIRRFLLYPLVIPLIAIFALHVRAGLTLHFLDIGQGDCCVMEMPGGQNVMVDGGSSTVYDVGAYRIMPFLKYEGIQRLDYVFLTHMDSDHTSGVIELLEAVRDGETAIRVDKLVLPVLKEHGEAYRQMEELAGEAGVKILYVEKGDAFAFEGIKSGKADTLASGAIKSGKSDAIASEGTKNGKPDGNRTVHFEILGPDVSVETVPVDENGQCITFALRCGGFDCLMTGDVQNAGEERMVECLRKVGYRAEILKVAHHGSKYSTPQEFLDFLRPEISVISCGKDNWYGHPHAALLRRLMKVNTEILRTDECGEVSVWTDGKRYRVGTFVRASRR